MQQVVAAFLRFAQPLRCSVAAHEERRNRRTEHVAQHGNCRDPCLPVRELKIGGDEIGRFCARKCGDDRIRRRRGRNAATPLVQQPAQALQHKPVIVDNNDEPAPPLVVCPCRRESLPWT